MGDHIRSGFPIVILGAPNVGKSSLLNHLAQRDAAIVSERAGTTRDVLEVQLNLGGFTVSLADTAGLRAASDAIEAEGVRRAAARAADAALRLVVLDATQATVPAEVHGLLAGPCLVVANKADLLNGPYRPPDLPGETPPLPVSAATGEGLADLLSRLTSHVSDRLGAAETPVPTRQRHREALAEAGDALARVSGAAFPELAAEEVRMALRALGRITGRVDIDDILDTVFRDFCIGK